MKVKYIPKHHLQKSDRKMLYGKWINAGRPMKTMYKWHRHLRINRIRLKENSEYIAYWKGVPASEKGKYKTPTLFCFKTDKGEFIADKVYMEMDGLQHLTVECYEDKEIEGAWYTHFYPMTCYMNVEANYHMYDQYVRDGWMCKIKLTPDKIISLEPHDEEGMVFVLIFKP